MARKFWKLERKTVIGERGRRKGQIAATTVEREQGKG